MTGWMSRAGVGALVLVLGACSNAIVPPGSSSSRPPSQGYLPATRPIPATPISPVATTTIAGAATAVTAGLVAGPPISALPITDAQAVRALGAFRVSCNSLVRRTDTSGLTRGSDWQPACNAASGVSDSGARAFFERWFESVQVGDGKSLATGYYEPEIAGSRERRSGYEVPVYGRPNDLIEADLGLFSDDLKGKKVRGRVDKTAFVPYFDRTQIEQGALTGRAPIIAWAADGIELFFLQVQGSGRLRMPDGSIMRVGYESQNGRSYTGIGALMKSRGLLAPGQSSMQGIVQWLRDHPAEGRDIMRENKSYVFFREQQGPPLGAMGLPVTASASVAADIKYVPLGAPVFLSMDRTDATGLWVAQDTGGAIKGTNRFDTFWGAGTQAAATAGGMSARGTAFLLLPTGTLARLNGATRPPIR